MIRNLIIRDLKVYMLGVSLAFLHGCGSSGGSSQAESMSSRSADSNTEMSSSEINTSSLASVSSVEASSSSSQVVVEPEILSPLISFPANGATVKGITNIKVDLDDTVRYSKLELLVNGVSVASDDEAPFELKWNPYFNADVDEASLLVRATTQGGKTLRSTIALVGINHAFNNTAITLESPQDLSVYTHGTASLEVEWNDVFSASSYEYRVEGSNSIVQITETLATVSLLEGSNVVQVRANNGDVWGPWVSIADIEVAPPSAPLVSEAEIGESSLSRKINVELDPGANYSEVNLFVNDVLVQTLGQAPYEFAWNPYFFANGGAISWYVEAVHTDSRRFRSLSQSIDPAAEGYNELLEISLPDGVSEYYGVENITVSWTEIEGADSYEYSVFNVALPDLPVTPNTLTDKTSATLSSLAPGSYLVSVRAFDVDDNVSPLSTKGFELVLPGSPDFVSSERQYSNVDEVTIEWSNVIGALSYEIQEENGDWVMVEGLSTTLSIAEAGSYSVQVRAVDALGRPGAASIFVFDVLTPTAPSLLLGESITDTGIQLFADWEESPSEITLEIARDESFSDLLVSETYSDVSAYTSNELTAGKYYARLRAENSVGHKSDWSFTQEVNIGLFFIEPDIATDNFFSNDRPIDFVVDTANIVLLSANADLADATSDSFHIASLSIKSDNIQSDESFLSIARDPRHLAKTKDGVVAVGRSSGSFNDSVIVSANNLGQYLWHKTIRSEMPDENTRLDDRIQVAASLSDGRIIYASDYTEWTRDGLFSRITNQENRVTILDEGREDSKFITIPQPLEGKFYSISEMLVDNDEIFAVGRYMVDKNNDASGDVFTPTITTRNGAFLTKITAEGVIESTVTGSGLSNISPSSISKNGGSVVVGYSNYQRCAATLFNDDGSSEPIYFPELNYCHAVLNNNQEVVVVGKDNSDAILGEPLVVVRISNGVEIGRTSLNHLASNFTISRVKYDSVLGTVIVGTYKFGSSYDDTRTVVFNISDNFHHVVN